MKLNKVAEPIDDIQQQSSSFKISKSHSINSNDFSDKGLGGVG
jgi:hypothetical protein